MALAAGDLTSRASATDTNGASSSISETSGPDITLSSITVPSGDLIIVFASCAQYGSSSLTMACSDTQGLTWTKYGGNATDTSEYHQVHGNIFTAVSNGSATTITVTYRSGWTSESYATSVARAYSISGHNGVGTSGSAVHDPGVADPTLTLGAAPASSSLVVGYGVGNAEWTSRTFDAYTGYTSVVDAYTPNDAGGGLDYSGNYSHVHEVVEAREGSASTTVTWESNGELHKMALVAIEIQEAAGDTPVNSSDTGSGSSDSQAIAATRTETETGSGADSQSLTVALTVSDSGSGTESESYGSPVPGGDDPGSGTDSHTLTVVLSSDDTGAGVDSWSLVVVVSADDTGAGTDSGTAGADDDQDHGQYDISYSDEAVAERGLDGADEGAGAEGQDVGWVVHSFTVADTAHGFELQHVAKNAKRLTWLGVATQPRRGTVT